jgi:hypothetical protein
MVRSLDEDELIVGSTQGYVAWSSDGNDSWDKVNKQLHGAGNVQVTASGLDDGDYIYAATDVSGDRVERWEVSVRHFLEEPVSSSHWSQGLWYRASG